MNEVARKLEIAKELIMLTLWEDNDKLLLRIR